MKLSTKLIVYNSQREGNFTAMIMFGKFPCSAKT